MGARGPKGEPVALKRMKGNPGKHKLPEDFVEASGDAELPAHVVGYAAQVWERITASMPAGVYRATDTGLLAAYCIACARQVQALAWLTIEGEVITLETKMGETRKRNPWSVILSEANTQIATLGTRLGLDPLARENIKAPDKRPKSKFTGLVGIDGGKA